MKYTIISLFINKRWWLKRSFLAKELRRMTACLVDAVVGDPGEVSADDQRPRCVARRRVRVETKWEKCAHIISSTMLITLKICFFFIAYCDWRLSATAEVMRDFWFRLIGVYFEVWSAIRSNRDSSDTKGIQSISRLTPSCACHTSRWGEKSQSAKKGICALRLIKRSW